MSRALAFIAPIAFLACLPTALVAQIEALDPFQRTVQRELRRYESEFEVQDMTHAVYMSSLREGSSETLTVELEGGVDYLILGVCDEDCDDLDLELFQGNTAVDDDMATDDFPVVTVEPSADRTYRLRVTMAGCDVAPCRYGIAVYERD